MHALAAGAEDVEWEGEEEEYEGEEGEEGEGEGEEEEEEGEEEEETSWLLFSSEHWRLLVVPAPPPRGDPQPARAAPRPAPRAAAADELRQLHELFPQLSDSALRRALLRHHTLEGAVEQLLGDVE